MRDGLRVLDVGCGKGWLHRRWASRWAIDGTGLELNRWFCAYARAQAEARAIGERLRFIEGPALEFKSEPASYDIVLCTGASFALGDFEPPIAWMKDALKPGGVIAIGDVFAAETPFPLEGRDQQPPTLAARIDTLKQASFDVMALIAASQDDWDHYESQHWRAFHAWAVANTGHPDRFELLERHIRSRDQYFAWERRYFGWAIFVIRRSLTS